MSSLIEGYNYDVFISYRQKDNKHDGWVTEFVDNLKGELESTIKEEISVYFDINPHDGLLETHDVDESLKEKLKCLIFIPIISRTYCDPKAFAWEHEFKAFVEQASKDEFGLKVKLPNGNVANRVLPIVIYDLDKQDIKLCESVLGGALRGVEYIYKSSGVNRPLRANEDHPQDNINKTYYRDQVNKVANTIKDVLNSLTERETSIDEDIPESAIIDEKIIDKKVTKKKTREIPSVSFFYRLKNLTAFSQRTWHIIALVLLIISVGSIWFGLKKAHPPTDRPVFRSDIPLHTNLGSTGRRALALSSDGEYLVYCMNEELNVIQLNSNAPSQPISGTSNSLSPFFSPDGSWIGFMNWREMKIMKIPVTGGNPVTICDIELLFNEGNWYEHEIIYADGSAIFRVPDSGGSPELLYPLVKSDNDPILWNPQLLPDKKTLLFSQQQKEGGWSIMTWRLGSNESPVVLVERGRYGRYLESGHVTYTLNNRLFICRFNSRTNRIISEPQIIATNPVWEHVGSAYGLSQFDFSDNGILVYYEQISSGLTSLVWVDESGSVDPITRDAKAYVYTVISSDAQYIAASVHSEGSGYQVEIIDTKTGTSDLFAENANCPIWSNDNSSIFYVSVTPNNQVFQQPLDRSTPPVMLFEIDSVTGIRLQNLTSDGRYLPLYVSKTGADIWDIGYYDMVNSKVEMLDYYNSDDNESRTTISSDGKWVAYASNNSGQAAIYVAPFPGPGQPIRVTSGRTTNDINYPVWAPDMTALYYRTTIPDYELWRINMRFSENDFTFEKAQSFFNGGNNFVSGTDYEIHPSGDRFLIKQGEEAGTEEGIEPRIKVIVNWEQELERN